MSNDHLVQSIVAAGPRNEADYEAVYAAVNATERGRWFLAEFARRNRSVDTELVLAAVTRIEAYIRGEAPSVATARGDKDDEKTANTLRGRLAALAPGASFLAPNQPPSDTARMPSEPDAHDALIGSRAAFTEPAQQPPDVPEPAAQLPVPPQFEPAEHAQADPASAASAQDHAVRDKSPRWHIEAPDFVFSGGGRRSDVEMESASSVAHQTQLSGAQLLAESTDDAAGSFRRAQGIVVALEFASESTAAAPTSASATGRESLPESSRPQLRVANVGASTHHSPIRSGPLSVADALSEDEVIALFG
jgi:hypothetical protein